MSLVSFDRLLTAGGLVLTALSPGLQDASAGSVSVQFEVRAHLVSATAPGTASPQCRGAGDPLTLACASPASASPTYLQPRPTLGGASLLDGWLTPDTHTNAYGSLYAASLTTRLVRYQDWEYVETLVSW